MVRNRPEGEVEHLTICPTDLLAVLKDTDNDIRMTMTVFPQELLTLVAFPEHSEPFYSSVSVAHGSVSRVLLLRRAAVSVMLDTAADEIEFTAVFGNFLSGRRTLSTRLYVMLWKSSREYRTVSFSSGTIGAASQRCHGRQRGCFL